jgi:hypothetical protein
MLILRRTRQRHSPADNRQPLPTDQAGVRTCADPNALVMNFSPTAGWK